MALNDAIGRALPDLGDYLSRITEEEGVALTDIRERHLERALKEAVEASTNGGSVTNRVLSIDDWPSLGRSGVDFVLAAEPGGPPLHVAELKWCQLGEDKIYEAIWDLFKVALALASVDTVSSASLVTAAPAAMWAKTFCRDLFEGGEFSPTSLCARRHPGSRSNRTGWDYLLEGGHDRAPDRVPALIRTTPIGLATVTDSEAAWEIRAVDVVPVHGAGMVKFGGGWPEGDRPAAARHPLG